MAQNSFKIGKSLSLTPQSGVPSSPTDGDTYYDESLNQFRFYENGAWQTLGSGSGQGAFNYVLNSGAESTATSDVTAVGLSVSRGTTEGDFSDSYFIIDSATVGNSTATWDTATQNQKDVDKYLKFSAKVRLNLNSGSSGEYKIGLYNITDGQYVAGTETTLIDGQTLHVGSGFLFEDGKVYKPRVQTVVVGDTTDEILVDDIFVGIPGASASPALSGWQSFTPTGSWSSNTTYYGSKRRVGDSLEMFIYITLSGAPNSADLSITLPDSLNYNSSALPDSSNPRLSTVGTAYLSDAGTASNRQTVSVRPSGSNTTSIQLLSEGLVDQSTPFTFATNDQIYIHAVVPIEEWSGTGTLDVFKEDNLTEPTSYSEVSNLTTNIEGQSGVWWRSGDRLFATGALEFSGTNTEGAVLLTVPNNYTIDTTKLPDTTGYFASGIAGLPVGKVILSDASDSNRVYEGLVVYRTSSGALEIFFIDQDLNMNTSANRPITIADGDQLSFTFDLPIEEFAGSQSSLIGFGEGTAENAGLVKKQKYTTTVTSTGTTPTFNNIQFTFTKVDDLVTMEVESFSDNITSGGFIRFNGAVPAELRPANTVGNPVVTLESGTWGTGGVQVFTSGDVRFGGSSIVDTFGTGSGGVAIGFSMSWHI